MININRYNPFKQKLSVIFNSFDMNTRILGPSLGVQWLELDTPNAGESGSIPGQGTKILNAARWGQKEKKQEILRRRSLDQWFSTQLVLSKYWIVNYDGSQANTGIAKLGSEGRAQIYEMSRR